MAETMVSAFALRAGAPDAIWPLPEWLTQPVDDEPYAWSHRICDDPAYQWAVRAWRNAAMVEGSWFDHGLADGIIADWPEWARLTTDRFAGVPFKLLKWQEITVRLLVGWMVPQEVLDPETHQKRFEHVRLFRRLMLWIPRKNGKTEFLAALALLFFTMDGLIGGECYVFARDEDQALTPFRKMKDMASMSPALSSDILPYKKALWSKSLRAGIQVLTGAFAGKHGKGPSVIVGDEMHEWRSLEIAQTLRQGTGARLQPIELYASTAGKKSNLVGMGLWDESVSIADGRIFDPTTLVVMFGAPQDADYRDETVWRAANPSLGLSPTLAFLRREAALCQDNPRAEAAFRCYHLNQWIDGEVRWIPLKKWDACAEDMAAWRAYPERFIGRKCFGAFDISSTTDLTALVWVFPPTEDDPKWRVVPRFWMPKENVQTRVLNDKVDYDKWVAAPFECLETTPGDYVDQDYVLGAILDGIQTYDVQAIGYDPWNSTKLITDLQKQGVPVEKLKLMRQGIQTLGEPSKHFEKLVYAGLLDHGGHPILRWMAGHVTVHFDRNLNYAPDKKSAGEKIDGIVAAVMAVGLALAGQEPEEPASPFDDPDFDYGNWANKREAA